MGRWTQYDSDEYRLPEGMKRVGYDADTQTYFYRDKDGSLWKGSEGAEYGELKRLNKSPDYSDLDDVESADRRKIGSSSYHAVSSSSADVSQIPQAPRSNAYRTLFPFFLLVCVVLLLAWRLVLLPSRSPPSKAVACPQDTVPYFIVSGDACWDIAKSQGSNVEALAKVNVGLDCDRLLPGQKICVPLRRR